MLKPLKKLTKMQWLNIIAACMTITVGMVGLLASVASWPGIVLAVTFCVLFSLSWAILVIEEFRYSRKARYAEACNLLHGCYHGIRDAWYSWQAHDSKDAVKSHLRNSLKDFALAFSLITGTHCRACVKMTYVVDANANPGRMWAVKTYCRNDDTEERVHPSGHDWVDDNSDFEELMRADHEPATRRFLHNDLSYPGYKNSHYNAEEIQNRAMTYASTVVWPIRKKLEGQPDDLLGFLCVDSKARNVFEERYDVEVGAAYADALYILLQPLLKLDSRETTSEEAEER